MKNKYILLAIVVLGIAAFVIWNEKNREKELVQAPDDSQPTLSTSIPTTGEYCFMRIQKATEAAPYSAEEHVVLNFNGTSVNGTKRGTQAGPDMTNGYEGTLTGSTIVAEDATREMELTFNYVVEGSQNRELEVYTMTDGNLVKKRWVLKDTKINRQSILVPDYVGDPMLITYMPETCSK